MKEIIKEITHASEQIKEIKTEWPDDKTRPESMKLLMMRWREYRRGLIRACEHMGLRPTARDLEGLKWMLEIA